MHKRYLAYRFWGGRQDSCAFPHLTLHTLCSRLVFTPRVHASCSHLVFTPHLHTSCSHLIFTPRVHASCSHFVFAGLLFHCDFGHFIRNRHCLHYSGHFVPNRTFRLCVVRRAPCPERKRIKQCSPVRASSWRARPAFSNKSARPLGNAASHSRGRPARTST